MLWKCVALRDGRCPAEVLHGTASRDQLPRVLAFFNKTHELWLGRVAMIGIVGTAVLEAVKGSPLIGG